MTLEPWALFTIGFALLILFIWYLSSLSERVKRISGTVLTVMMTYLAVVSFVPAFDQFDADGKRTVRGKIGQGIDLRGGLKFDLQLKPEIGPDGKERAFSPDALDRAIETFRKRVDAGGIGEPVIQPRQPDRIIIELPGVGPDDAQRWENTLKKVAKLEFRMVHTNSEMLLREVEAKTSILDPAYEVVEYHHKEKGKPVVDKIIVGKKVEISGDKISGAGVMIGNMGGWDIHLAFNSEGEELFTKVTQRMAQNKRQRERFAIMLDKVVIQAAGLSDEAMDKGGISGGSAVITGDRDEEEARSVASALLNPLANPVEILSKSNTSASLGQDAIQSGILAGKLGVILTLVLTLLYYRFAGIVANVALIVFGLMLFGAMGMFGAVLTLPGIELDAHKNFVPVDWVSAVIARAVVDPAVRGETLHVTHPQPLSMAFVAELVQEAVESYSEAAAADDPDRCDEQWFADNLRTQLGVYAPYFRNDPVFDTAALDRFAGRLACPTLDRDVMLRMSKFAIAHDFGRYPPSIVPLEPEQRRRPARSI